MRQSDIRKEVSYQKRDWVSQKSDIRIEVGYQEVRSRLSENNVMPERKANIRTEVECHKGSLKLEKESEVRKEARYQKRRPDA